MGGRITGFFREYIFGLSILAIIIGIPLFIIGIIGMWFSDVAIDLLNFNNEIIAWSLYLLIVGLIIFGTGVYYIYTYMSLRRFLLNELNTNKRSEFIKTHVELKESVRKLPSKYKEMLKDKEKELRIK
jgi:hypothetical protein